MRTLATLLALPLLLLAVACGGDDGGGTSGGETPTTVSSICAKVFTCFDDNWGWDTEASCQELWRTDCKASDAYLVCAKPCVDGACDAFDSCEPACWDAHCQ